MKLTNVEKQEEQLLSRTKVSCKGEFNAATPSSSDVQKAIATQLKCKEDVVVVKGIYTHFGKREADINVLVYNDAESLKKVERVKEKKDAKGEAKPAEEKKEEAPKAEEKKEEKAAKEKPADKKEEPKAEEKKE